MKIKIAILEQDAGYLSRITNVFNVRYADKLEVYSFTTYEGAMEALDTKRIDVLLADDSFEIDEESLPRRCGFAYLVDSAGIESVRDCVAICKFQKADLIYKQILGVYSEKAESISKLSSQVDEDCSVVAFMSPAGGVGTSSIAAACARRFAGHRVNVFYLNLEKFGTKELEKLDGFVGVNTPPVQLQVPPVSPVNVSPMMPTPQPAPAPNPVPSGGMNFSGGGVNPVKPVSLGKEPIHIVVQENVQPPKNLPNGNQMSGMNIPGKVVPPSNLNIPGKGAMPSTMDIPGKENVVIPTNHTYINGVMIQSNVEMELAHGMNLRLANEEFEFRML